MVILLLLRIFVTTEEASYKSMSDTMETPVLYRLIRSTYYIDVNKSPHGNVVIVLIFSIRETQVIDFSFSFYYGNV